MALTRLLGLLGLGTLVWSATAQAATVPVSVSSFVFSPATVNINVGDTVQWTGVGSGHDVAQSANAGSNVYDGTGFTSGSTSSGVSTFSFTFNTPGTYFYVCVAHAAGFGMKGVVNVAAPPTPTITVSPTITSTPTETPVYSPTDSPTPSPSFTETPVATVTMTGTSTPTYTSTPTATPSFTPVTQTPSPTPGPPSFTGLKTCALATSPIMDGNLRLWLDLTGAADDSEVEVYSVSFNRVATLKPGPLPAGAGRVTLTLPPLANQMVWIRVRVSQGGQWRQGPILRSYVLR